MTIFDNGDGIDLKTVKFGKGFSTVQQKSEAFGGTFNLESIEGTTGFTMEVII
jgi:glucose-6-phosphate-specific signal transduction histidine kinase